MEAPGASGVRPGVCPRDTRPPVPTLGAGARRKAGGVTCRRPPHSGERGNCLASGSRRSQLSGSSPRSPPPPTPPTLAGLSQAWRAAGQK
ncbi:WAS/WASL-interacting protein family member 1-like [Cervus canadensis]|uniref:WAS/WASL-interacting protein family member 1-like n=1 Tax=Cervus canadensis TaxID=1574408 RepID=UPI001CA34E0B|nr:WAS/WASL-interacting protein family member 1-like [Cervus canadensis]